jgi:hypothetical protein
MAWKIPVVLMCVTLNQPHLSGSYVCRLDRNLILVPNRNFQTGGTINWTATHRVSNLQIIDAHKKGDLQAAR